METIGLMRGNLLEVDGNYWTVDAILDKELYFVENDDYNHILNANPIPLTEDWLVKFGFVNREKDNFSFTEYFDLRILGSEHDYNGLWFGRIEHVHQLQNLYFALTGQELELKQTTEVNQ